LIVVGGVVDASLDVVLSIFSDAATLRESVIDARCTLLKLG